MHRKKKTKRIWETSLICTVLLVTMYERRFPQKEISYMHLSRLSATVPYRNYRKKNLTV